MGGISGFLTNFSPFTNLFESILEKIPVKLPIPLDKMVSYVSYPRTGRHLQRYDNRGFRLVVGCIPYRYKKLEEASSNEEEIEVLVISAQNGKGMLFPKGGWENDESMEDAAIRETLEEAGVLGIIECKLGKWSYKSKRQSIFHEGHMFPLLVTISKAREECPHLWMKEALEELVRRHVQPATDEKVN
ncbi:nudix hydrolase 21, chloroplastic-like [Gossypium australe]|uniref:Nudix hydrolase 21, chloroplastic-like n=1 Tax=Gossypium australe TaxID=47621 RepID=A0A5B6UZ74_9ROSI|nr:nudix hydrolase 21, chloroplastic-like [Gossypium australe]